jgi:hypothetical protein
MQEEKMNLQKFEKTVEGFLGEPISSIRKKPIDERRNEIEKKSKRSLHFKSYFPFIGRGNVLRDYVVTHEDADKALKKALR